MWLKQLHKSTCIDSFGIDDVVGALLLTLAPYLWDSSPSVRSSFLVGLSGVLLFHWLKCHREIDRQRVCGSVALSLKDRD